MRPIGRNRAIGRSPAGALLRRQPPDRAYASAQATENVGAGGTAVVAGIAENQQQRASPERCEVATFDLAEHLAEVRERVKIHRGMRDELAVFDRRFDRVIHERHDAQAPQQVPARAEQCDEEVGRVTHRARDIAQRDHVDASGTTSTKLEFERHASMPDGAAKRAAKVEPARPARGAQATAQSTAKAPRKILGEADELFGLEGIERAKRLGEQHTAAAATLDASSAIGRVVSSGFPRRP